MSEVPAPSLAALGATPRIVLEGMSHRGQLATLELAEARNHAALTASLAALAGALTLLAGFALTFAIAASVWHRDDRGLILGLVTCAYVIGAGGLAWWVVNRLKTWRPLAETRHQLSEDYECLREFIHHEHTS